MPLQEGMETTGEQIIHEVLTAEKSLAQEIAVENELQVSVLEAHSPNNGQSNTIERNPDDKRPGHRLRGCERRIQTVCGLTHGH